jgi:hypothetical protein
MKDPFYATMFKIQAELKILSEACLNGVESWDKYNQLIGRARGLQETLDIMNEVLKEDEEDDEHRK